jgi:nitrogen fixation/metabolism regulation signal transduction histidine kinase
MLKRPIEPYITTKAKGTGLGLAIVNKIVEEHGGRIHLENLVAGGARVSVLLPLAVQDEAQRSVPASVAHG